MPAPADDRAVASEARAFARYLVRSDPTPDLVERYRAACARLFTEPPDAVDAALLAFVRERPWSIGMLDSALALLRPQSLVRARLLVMAAVLETTPRHVREFLPRPSSLGSLALRLPLLGVKAIAQAAAGAALYAFVRGRT